MRIDVSGQKFLFPPRCACCFDHANDSLVVSASRSTGKKVVHTQTKAWDFPYCAKCVRHVRSAEAATVLLGVLAGSSLLAGVWLWIATSPPIGIAVAIGALVGTMLLHYRRMGSAKKGCGQECVSVSRAVEYLGWHGTAHQFWIASRDYASAFMVANERKLINLSPEARALLQARAHGPSQGALRAPRRHRS